MVKLPTNQETCVLSHVGRYRLTTAELIAARGLGCDGTLSGANEVLERLVRNGWLRRGTLCPGKSETYFLLSQRAAEVLEYDERVAHELSLDNRLERYAIARFCCGDKPFRELMTEQEFRASFPELWHPGQPLRYYLENDGGHVRLAFVKVDLGGPSQWDRVVDSCLRFLAKRTTRSRLDSQYHAQADLVRQMVDQGRFQVSLLVACREKASAIEARLDMDVLEGRQRAPIVPHVVPSLFDLLLCAAPRRWASTSGRRRRASRSRGR